MRPLARLVSWLVVLELGQITLAWACSCDPRTPEELVAGGEPIVVATILAVEDPSASGDPASTPEPEAGRSGGCSGSSPPSDRASSARAWEPLVVRIEITEVVTGQAAIGPLEVHANRDSVDCGLALVEGETWVLDLHENADGPYVSACGASARIEGDDDPWLATLREAAAAR